MKTSQWDIPSVLLMEYKQAFIVGITFVIVVYMGCFSCYRSSRDNKAVATCFFQPRISSWCRNIKAGWGNMSTFTFDLMVPLFRWAHSSTPVELRYFICTFKKKNAKQSRDVILVCGFWLNFLHRTSEAQIYWAEENEWVFCFVLRAFPLLKSRQ